MAVEVQQTIERVLQHADSISDPAFFAIMFGGSLLEYVFPPVPGDLWTAAGAILVARGKKFATIFFAVNLGSAAGFLIDYLFGRWLAKPERKFRTWGPRWQRTGRAIDEIARGFDRHPALYLIIHRFLPGVRSLFFVAAGFARVPIWKVLAFGLVSSIAWNLALIGAGMWVGASFDRLSALLARYTWAAWLAVIVVVTVAVVRWRRRRRAAGADESNRPSA